MVAPGGRAPGVAICNRGSPAHAGMDPASSSPLAARWGLPRARGDGPRAHARHAARRQAPPRTRGWTGPGLDLEAEVLGSPAHAGMDRRSRCRGPGRRWLPRARGDGPLLRTVAACATVAPPRTRGWTAHRAGFVGPVPGSPAHAGMDPRPRDAHPGCARLPRARGDGPQARRSGPGRSWAPPRTRGWTPHAARAHQARAGSPAHAGMDPGCSWPRPRTAGLPRARGDGPGSGPPPAPIRGAPPRTRGWT